MNPFAVTGGAGGLQWSGGTAASETGPTSGSAGGQSFNFVPPMSVQEKAISTPVVLAGLAVVGLWLYSRRR